MSAVRSRRIAATTVTSALVWSLCVAPGCVFFANPESDPGGGQDMMGVDMAGDQGGPVDMPPLPDMPDPDMPEDMACVSACELNTSSCVGPNGQGSEYTACVQGEGELCPSQTTLSCPTGTRCDDSSGLVVCQGESCEDDCDPETFNSMCMGPKARTTCALDEESGCTVMSTVPCGVAQLCDTGAGGAMCVCDPQQRCERDTVRCNPRNGRPQTCEQSVVSGCLVWRDTNAECASGSTCVEGTCTCTSPICTEGEMQCGMNGVRGRPQRCELADGDVCPMWVNDRVCRTDEVCDDSNAPTSVSCEPEACVSTCAVTVKGQGRCVDTIVNTYEVCVEVELNCYKWVRQVCPATGSGELLYCLAGSPNQAIECKVGEAGVKCDSTSCTACTQSPTGGAGPMCFP